MNEKTPLLTNTFECKICLDEIPLDKQCITKFRNNYQYDSKSCNHHLDICQDCFNEYKKQNRYKLLLKCPEPKCPNTIQINNFNNNNDIVIQIDNQTEKELEKYHQCSKCGINIERIEGCNNIRCAVCDNKFKYMPKERYRKERCVHIMLSILTIILSLPIMTILLYFTTEGGISLSDHQDFLNFIKANSCIKTGDHLTIEFHDHHETIEAFYILEIYVQYTTIDNIIKNGTIDDYMSYDRFYIDEKQQKNVTECYYHPECQNNGCVKLEINYLKKVLLLTTFIISSIICILLCIFIHKLQYEITR